MLWTYRNTRAGFLITIAAAFFLMGWTGPNWERFLYHVLLFVTYIGLCIAQSKLIGRKSAMPDEWMGRMVYKVILPAWLVTMVLYYTQVHRPFHIYDALSWVQILFCYTLLALGEHCRRKHKLPFF